MTTRSCCREATRWVVPGVGLALIPKCPMCVAAYVAAITGAGVSMPVAAGIRMGLLVLCVGALAYVTARTGARLIRWLKKGSESSATESNCFARSRLTAPGEENVRTDAAGRRLPV